MLYLIARLPAISFCVVYVCLKLAANATGLVTLFSRAEASQVRRRESSRLAVPSASSVCGNAHQKPRSQDIYGTPNCLPVLLVLTCW
jgi:hypothetical protein